MRSDDVNAINAIAERVGADAVLAIIMDDMTGTALRRLAGRLAVQFESPDDYALEMLINMMPQPDALALIAQAKAEKEYTTGQELLARCFELRVK
jgi:phage-related baseplate assembly protein